MQEQIKAIESTFDKAKNAPKHPSRNVHPIEILPILPDDKVALLIAFFNLTCIGSGLSTASCGISVLMLLALCCVVLCCVVLRCVVLWRCSCGATSLRKSSSTLIRLRRRGTSARTSRRLPLFTSSLTLPGLEPEFRICGCWCVCVA